jgi:hypothetical protein
MRLSITSFQTPKFGNSQEECEDAFYPKYVGKHKKPRFRSAVADGASVGMLSKVWAETLVRTFCEDTIENIDPKITVEKAQSSWVLWKEEYIKDREKNNKPIQWYEEPGLETGAFSTLLGLSLNNRNSWEAIGLGDSCLFQVRNDELLVKFPVDKIDCFNDRPLLIGSNFAHNKKVFNAFKSCSGNYQKGDLFFLMTDALAHWFLYLSEEFEEYPWRKLQDKLSQKHLDNQLNEWVNNYLRKETFVTNDDISVLQIEIL